MRVPFLKVRSSTLACFLSLSSVLARPPLPGDIRLLVPGMEGDAATTAPETSRALEAALRTGGVRPVPGGRGEIDRALLAAADAVLLDDRSVESMERWSDGSLSALLSSVRSGKGLVAMGGAAAALGESSAFSRLLGRKAAPEAGPGVDHHLVAFLDQSHPVTQCVTHLLLHPCSPRLDAVEAAVLASSTPVGTGPAALAPPRPAVWTRQESQGRVMVLGLRACGEGCGSRPVLAVLAARAVQWAAGRPVTVRLPDDLPLAASLLGPGGPGIAGLSPVEGFHRGFHRGREIAPVMSFHGADWLERDDREQTELPERVLDSLAIEEGSTVADLGAGTGYFTFRLARRVGPRGKVLATEVQEEMLALLEKRRVREGFTNVETIRATPLDPRLPSGAVDLALMVDVYHELTHPQPVLTELAKALAEKKEGKSPGRLVLVEYRGEDPLVPIKPLHRMTGKQVLAEIEPMGLRWVETKEFLPHQRIIIFERRPPAPERKEDKR